MYAPVITHREPAMPATSTMTPAAFLASCREAGVRVEACAGSKITLTKTFPAGDAAAYAGAESDVSILYSTPSAGAGSVWGTDGGSVGGMVGLKGGYMRLSKSNVARRFVAALAKLLPAPAP